MKVNNVRLPLFLILTLSLVLGIAFKYQRHTRAQNRRLTIQRFVPTFTPDAHADGEPAPTQTEFTTGDATPIGATAVLIVNSTADTTDGTCNAANCTLREAIAAANNGDSINFSALFNTPQTITLGGTQLIFNQTITINGPGPDLLTVSGNNLSRVFTINSGATVTMSGLTVSNGRPASGENGAGVNNSGVLTLFNCKFNGNVATDAGSGTANGGGIFSSGRLNAIGSQFTNNTARNGGALAFGGANAQSVSNSTFSGNNANNGGGALYTLPGAKVTGNNLTITGNSAAGGGALLNNSEFTLTSSTLSNNTATSTGGGAYNFSVLTINSSTFSANTTTGFGGALISVGSLTVTSSSFSGNSAGNGSAMAIGGTAALTNTLVNNNTATFQGALNIQGATVTMTNCTVSGNTAGSYPGGILYATEVGVSQTLTVTNCTVTGNSGQIGGIVSLTDGTASNSLKLKNTLVAANPGGNFGFDGALISLGNNLDSDGSSEFVNGTNGDKVGTSGSPINALLGPLANNGGPTRTHSLLAGSPALDAGNSAGTGVTTDQRGIGFARLVDLAGVANAADGTDIGAYEAQFTPGSLLVTNTNNAGAGSLRQVIADAPADGTIGFDPAVFGGQNVITLTTGELVIDKNLTINGPGANLLTVNGNNLSRVFRVFFATISLNGLKITGGNGNGLPGGGIRVSSGNLTVSNCDITGNVADDGGGILNDGTLTLRQSTLSNNSCTGSNCGGGLASGDTLTVVNSTITGNAANVGGPTNGGGVINYGGTATITNSTITHNSALGTSSAGGYCVRGGTVTIRNTIIAGNLNNSTMPDVSQNVGTFSSGGFNLIGNRGAVSTFTNGVNNDLAGSAATPLAPGLGSLANNGGPTPTHALLSTSPALDKGNNSGANVSTDQRGLPRVVDLPNTNAADGADIGAFEQQVGAPAQSITGFKATSYSVNEDAGSVTITVNRSGDTSGVTTVDFATSDLAEAQACNVTNGVASSRCDYETSLGTITFAAGETSRSITILLINDSYLEGPETLTVTLTNASGGTLNSASSATVTIVDNETSNGVNPVDTSSFFVRQHYLDFLNREGDSSGLAFWTNDIASCNGVPACIEVKRVNVSAAFYLSIEFQQTGYLVERIYKTAFGDATGASTFPNAHQVSVPIVRLLEFLGDTQQIGQGVVVGQAGWETVLENNKQSYCGSFVQRSRFTTAFPTSLTPAQFVDALFANAGVTPSAAERQAAIDEFGGAANTTNATARGRALRRVAEHPTLVQNESNRAFVLMQYFGYLRRNPNDPGDSDYTGYDFWLTKLNQFNGDFAQAEMVKAFITSSEYRNRFGPPPP